MAALFFTSIKETNGYECVNAYRLFRPLDFLGELLVIVLVLEILALILVKLTNLDYLLKLAILSLKSPILYMFYILL